LREIEKEVRCTIITPRAIRAGVYGGGDTAKKLEHDTKNKKVEEDRGDEISRKEFSWVQYRHCTRGDRSRL
jgi:hypothetical protein